MKGSGCLSSTLLAGCWTAESEVGSVECGRKVQVD